MIRRPPRSTLFPSTPLFRSVDGFAGRVAAEAARFVLLLAKVGDRPPLGRGRSEEHTSELQSQSNLVCRLLLEKKKHKGHASDRAPKHRAHTPARHRLARCHP